MKDLLPDRVAVWQHVETCVREVFASYGYEEIRPPLVEKTELFARSIGEHTDIVAKEMYSFADSNGESLSLRPEATASCVRVGIEHGMFRSPALRLWYGGPMFRRERPQKGRYRQFHQFGIETFGWEGPDIDAEIILVAARIWERLGVAGAVSLSLNSLGTPASRTGYRRALVSYLEGRRDELDEDSRRRLHTNPMRVLDSKNPQMQDVIAGAPVLLEHLDADSRRHFEALCSLLDAAGVRYRIEPRLVRGLDYYTRTVFEWVTTELGAQGTVCGGGRYDGLVEEIGGPPTPAAGFALGTDRLVDLIGITGQVVAEAAPDAYVAVLSEDLREAAQGVAETLRDAGLSAVLHCGGGSLKSQMRRADRSGACAVVLIGSEEWATGEASVKPLRGAGAQTRVPLPGLAEVVRAVARGNAAGNDGARTTPVVVQEGES